MGMLVRHQGFIVKNKKTGRGVSEFLFSDSRNRKNVDIDVLPRSNTIKPL